MRKIVVNSVLYEWMLGHSYILIKKNGKRFRLLTLSEFTGWDWNSIERAKWKGYFHITPKHIADYVKQNTKTEK